MALSKNNWSCDDINCMKFLPGFLECLGPVGRKKYITSYHEVEMWRMIGNQNLSALKKFQEIEPYLKSARPVNKTAHYVLTRRFLLWLSKDEKRELVQILEEWDGKDCWDYLIIGELYEDLEDYILASDAHGRASKLLRKFDSVKKALVHLKQAWNYFYSGYRHLSAKHQAEGIRLLEKIDPSLNGIEDPCSEEAVLLSEAYETNSKLFIRRGDVSQSRIYVKKCLRISYLNSETPMQTLQYLVEFGTLYVHTYDFNGREYAQEYLDGAREYIEVILDDAAFMQHHSMSFALNISKVGRNYRMLSRDIHIVCRTYEMNGQDFSLPRIEDLNNKG